MNKSILYKKSCTPLHLPFSRNKLSLFVKSALCVTSIFLSHHSVAQEANTSGSQVYNNHSDNISIVFDGVNTNIEQANSQIATINWEGFSVNQGETVNFQQGGSNWIVVNEVTGIGNETAIMGNINAQGVVYILNPNGILFGNGSQVNVSGLVASTLSVDNLSELQGTESDAAGLQFNFSGGSSGSSVVNEGTITAGAGISILGNYVLNEGRLEVTGSIGQINLLSAERTTLSFDNNGLMQFTLTEALASKIDDSIIEAVRNSGTIVAPSIFVTAEAIDDVFANSVNNTGIVNATNLTINASGDVILSGTNSVNKVKIEGGDVTLNSVSGISGQLDVEAFGALAVTKNVNVTDSISLVADSITVNELRTSRGNNSSISLESTGVGNLLEFKMLISDSVFATSNGDLKQGDIIIGVPADIEANSVTLIGNNITLQNVISLEDNLTIEATGLVTLPRLVNINNNLDITGGDLDARKLIAGNDITLNLINANLNASFLLPDINAGNNFTLDASLGAIPVNIGQVAGTSVVADSILLSGGDINLSDFSVTKEFVAVSSGLLTLPDVVVSEKIELTANVLNISDVEVTGTNGSASLTQNKADEALTLNNVDVGNSGTLTVTSNAGAISQQSNSKIIAANAEFSTGTQGGSIALQSLELSKSLVANTQGELTISTALNVADRIELSGGYINFDSLSVQAGDSGEIVINQSGTGNELTLSTIDAGTGTVTIENNAGVVRQSDNAELVAGNLTIDTGVSGGAVTISDVNISENIDIVSGGNVVLINDISVGKTIDINGADISFQSLTTGSNGSVELTTTSNNELVLNNIDTGDLIITANGSIGQANLSSITTDTASITSNQDVVLSASNDFASAINVSGQAIRINDSNSVLLGQMSGQVIEVTAQESIEMQDALSGFNNVELSANQLTLLAISASDSISLTSDTGITLSDINTDQLIVDAGGNLEQKTNTFIATGAAQLTATGNILLNNANDFSGVVNASASTINLNDTNNLTLGNVNGAELVVNSAQQLSMQHDLTGFYNVSLSAQSLLLQDIQANNSVKIASDGAGVVLAGIDATSFNLSASGNIAQQAGSVVLVDSANINSSANVTMGNANDFKGNVEVTAREILVNDINSLSLTDVSAASLAATAVNALSLANVTVDNTVSATSNGVLSLNNVNANSVSVTAGSELSLVNVKAANSVTAISEGVATLDNINADAVVATAIDELSLTNVTTANDISAISEGLAILDNIDATTLFATADNSLLLSNIDANSVSAQSNGELAVNFASVTALTANASGNLLLENVSAGEISATTNGLLTVSDVNATEILALANDMAFNLVTSDTVSVEAANVLSLSNIESNIVEATSGNSLVLDNISADSLVASSVNELTMQSELTGLSTVTLTADSLNLDAISATGKVELSSAQDISLHSVTAGELLVNTDGNVTQQAETLMSVEEASFIAQGDVLLSNLNDFSGVLSVEGNNIVVQDSNDLILGNVISEGNFNVASVNGNIVQATETQVNSSSLSIFVSQGATATLSNANNSLGSEVELEGGGTYVLNTLQSQTLLLQQNVGVVEGLTLVSGTTDSTRVTPDVVAESSITASGVVDIRGNYLSLRDVTGKEVALSARNTIEAGFVTGTESVSYISLGSAIAENDVDESFAGVQTIKTDGTDSSNIKLVLSSSEVTASIGNVIPKQSNIVNNTSDQQVTNAINALFGTVVGVPVSPIGSELAVFTATLGNEVVTSSSNLQAIGSGTQAAVTTARSDNEVEVAQGDVVEESENIFKTQEQSIKLPEDQKPADEFALISTSIKPTGSKPQMGGAK